MHASIHAPLPSIDKGRDIQVPSQSQQQQLVVGRECTGIYLPSSNSSTCSTYSSTYTCSSSVQAEWEGMTLPQYQKPIPITIYQIQPIDVQIGVALDNCEQELKLHRAAITWTCCRGYIRVVVITQVWSCTEKYCHIQSTGHFCHRYM